jgi:hypothetical protein
MQQGRNNYDLFVKRWTWLFPFTFLFHILEEYYGGFPHWVARVFGAELSPSQFLNFNTFFWVVMAVGTLAAMLIPFLRWFALMFAAMVTINGSAHLIGSVATMSYSPGVITGTILWLPLGVYTLRLAYKNLERAQFFLVILLGTVLHLMVLMLAFNMANRSQ